MKKVFLFISLVISSFCANAQDLLTEDFQSYQGFGDALTGGWTSGQFKVYYRNDTSLTTNSKLCSVNINNNHKSDSVTTPVFGPLGENAVMSFRSRLCGYTGSYPTTGYVMSGGDKLVAYVSVDGGMYQMISDLTATHATTTNKWTHVSIPLSGFAGSNVKVKLKIVRGTIGTEWYTDFDNFVASNLTSNKSLQMQPEVELMPNPSTGLFTINATRFGAKAMAEVYNILGTKVFQAYLGNGRIQADLSDQKAGIYIIKVTEGKTTLIKRLILK